MIYFIGPETREAVKIGYTRGPVNARLATLQTGSYQVLVVFGTGPGELDDEAGLHKRFAEWHIRGEWFFFSPAIERYLRQLEKEERRRTRQQRRNKRQRAWRIRRREEQTAYYASEEGQRVLWAVLENRGTTPVLQNTPVLQDVTKP